MILNYVFIVMCVYVFVDIVSYHLFMCNWNGSLKKATPTYHWKGYPNMSLKLYSDVSLKRLWWWVTCHLKGYPDMWIKVYSNVSLKRLPRHIIKKGYVDEWPVIENATLTSDGSLKMLPQHITKRLPRHVIETLHWCVTKKATVMSDGSLKRLPRHVT
jgi:hypothetical protein